MEETTGPLAGLRVLELATGVAGPYCGRLLAMLGADVVKVEPATGDPARTLPVDDLPVTDPSPVFVHLNAAKRLVTADAVDLDRGLRWADVVIDGRVRRDAVSLLAAASRAGRAVIASITAWGFEGEAAGEPGDELLVQAATGMLTETAADGREPLRFPGWQSQYLAGAHAAVAVLGVLERDGVTHVDVSWAGAALNGVEGGLCVALQAPGAAKQSGFQVGAFPSGAFACKDGFVIPGAVRAVDWDLQCVLYDMPGLRDDPRFAWRSRWENRDALRAAIQPWYDARTKREIFGAALEVGWAAAMVMTAADAVEDPHLAERRFLSSVTGAAQAVVPGRPWRSPSIPEPDTVRLEERGESNRSVGDLFAAETATAAAPGAVAVGVASVKVIELTWAWAGPSAGRYLGTLGADVVRVEVGKYPDGWRTRLRWREAGVDIPDGVDPDAYTWDAAALFNTLNRSKRGVSIDLATDGGRQAFLDLLDVADVLIANMTYSVLADRDIEREVRDAVDRGLVFANMPALGATGPYRDLPGYGMLMEGMGGFSARFGYADEGARASTTYYPDAIAGVHGALAVLAALTQRAATGRGTTIDLSQQETTWLQYGEGIALWSMEGREPRRIGNAEPGCPRSGIVAASDGGHVAFVGDTTVPCRTFRDAHDSGLLDELGLLERLDHPVTGTRPYVAAPVRIDGERLRSTRPAPLFAQHTDEVLAQWAGYEPSRLDELRASGAIGTVPSARRAAASG